MRASVGNRDGTGEVGPVERVRELDLQTKLEPVRTGERERTLEQRRRRAPVAAPEGTAACGAEPLARGEGELAVVLPELVEAACGPLQVVADQLVQLDELRPVLFDPIGEAAVQVGTRRLGECVVGGVSEQQVVEAKGVLAVKLGLLGADQPLAHERGQPRRHLPVG